MVWHVYVLVSLTSKIRYVGMTQNLSRRLLEHNAGKSKFTSGHLPWTMVYSESFANSKEARLREKYFKSYTGRRFLDDKLRNGSLPA